MTAGNRMKLANRTPPIAHAPITAGDWLDQVLYDINLDEDSRRLQ